MNFKEEPILFKEIVDYGGKEIIKISSFPLDYKGNDKEIGYLCGMSVLPVMMANVANNIYEQWLSKL